MDQPLLAGPAAVAILVVLGGAALVVAVLLVLLARTRRRAAVAEAARVGLERDRLDLEIELTEQTGRLRTVRELHEIAAAEIRAVAAQAEVARYQAADAEAALRAVAVVEERARRALAELRRSAALALEGEAAGVLEVMPGLGSLEELLALERESGLAVELSTIGEAGELTDGAEIAAVRIVQRALENVRAHAGEGTRTRVSLRWAPTRLQILIEDDGEQAAARAAAAGDEHAGGPGASAPEGEDAPRAAAALPTAVDQHADLDALVEVPAGPGITEMRQRAEVYGGSLQAARLPGVGFTVTAWLPVRRAGAAGGA